MAITSAKWFWIVCILCSTIYEYECTGIENKTDEEKLKDISDKFKYLLVDMLTKECDITKDYKFRSEDMGKDFKEVMESYCYKNYLLSTLLYAMTETCKHWNFTLYEDEHIGKTLAEILEMHCEILPLGEKFYELLKFLNEIRKPPKTTTRHKDLDNDSDPDIASDPDNDTDFDTVSSPFHNFHVKYPPKGVSSPDKVFTRDNDYKDSTHDIHEEAQKHNIHDEHNTQNSRTRGEYQFGGSSKLKPLGVKYVYGFIWIMFGYLLT